MASTVTLLAAFAAPLATSGFSAATNSHTRSPETVSVAQAGMSRALFVFWAQNCHQNRRCFAVTRSLDGELTFTRVGTLPVTFNRNNPSGSIYQLAFANAEDGLALINDTTKQNLLLFATFEGALTWHREENGAGPRIESITSTPMIRQLVFVSTQQGVTLGQGIGPVGNMTLYETSNAGTNWRVVRL